MKHEVAQLCAIQKAYRHSTVLEHLNLTLYQEDITFLTGDSGCGKSVLSRIIAGKLSPDAGSVRTMQGDPRERRIQAQVQYIGRDAALVDTLSVAENLCLPRLAGAISVRYAKKVRILAQSLFEAYQVKLDLDQNVRDLSYLSLLIVYCVRALHQKIKLIIFDDVMQPLTREERDVFFSWVQRLHTAGCCVLLCDMRRECGCANRILLLHGGAIAADLTPERYRMQQDALFSHADVPMPVYTTALQPKATASSPFYLPTLTGVRSIAPKRDGATGICISPAGAYRELFETVLRERTLEAYNPDIAVLRPEAFQSGYFPNLSVEENLLMPALRRIASGSVLLPKSHQRFIVEEWRSYISIDPTRWREPMRHFGRQQIQEVLLYRLLAKGAPRIVLVGLLDEADPLLHDKVLQFIRVAQQHQRYVILIGQHRRAVHEIEWMDVLQAHG